MQARVQATALNDQVEQLRRVYKAHEDAIRRAKEKADEERRIQAELVKEEKQARAAVAPEHHVLFESLPSDPEQLKAEIMRVKTSRESMMVDRNSLNEYRAKKQQLAKMEEELDEMKRSWDTIKTGVNILLVRNGRGLFESLAGIVCGVVSSLHHPLAESMDREHGEDLPQCEFSVQASNGTIEDSGGSLPPPLHGGT